MLSASAAIRSYFAKLGLEKEIADIYLALHSEGPQTISQLSRSAHVERTRIYRLIEQLMSSNLIEIESQHRRGVIKAAPIANLSILIAQREQELRSLQDELGLIEQVLARNSLSSPAIHVQLFEGAEGVKQMYQNVTNAKSEVLAVLFEDLQVQTDLGFYKRWVEQCNQREIRFRTLYGTQLLDQGQEAQTGKTTATLNAWESRYVPARLFPIDYTTMTYDATVASYHWVDGSVFGMEVRNNEITHAQKASFELLWQATQL